MVDANVLIAALLRDSTTRKLIVLGGMELHAPRYLLQEVEAHWEELTARSGVPLAALKAAWRTLRGYMIEHGPEQYEQQLEKAEAMLQDVDVQDAPYVALALAIGADCVWSEDRALTRVRGLRVVRTADLVRRSAE